MVVGRSDQMDLMKVVKMMSNSRMKRGNTEGRARREVMKARLVRPLSRAMLLRLCTQSA